MVHEQCGCKDLEGRLTTRVALAWQCAALVTLRTVVFQLNSEDLARTNQPTNGYTNQPISTNQLVAIPTVAHLSLQSGIERWGATYFWLQQKIKPSLTIGIHIIQCILYILTQGHALTPVIIWSSLKAWLTKLSIPMKTLPDYRSSSVVPCAATCTAGRTRWRTTSEGSTTSPSLASSTGSCRSSSLRRRTEERMASCRGGTKLTNKRSYQLAQIKETKLSKCDKIVISGPTFKDLE